MIPGQYYSTWQDVLPMNDDVFVPLNTVLLVQEAHSMHELVNWGPHSTQAARALEIHPLRAAYAPDGRPTARVGTFDHEVVFVLGLSRYKTDARFLVVLVHCSLDHRHVTVIFRSRANIIVIKV